MNRSTFILLLGIAVVSSYLMTPPRLLFTLSRKESERILPMSTPSILLHSTPFPPHNSNEKKKTVTLSNSYYDAKDSTRPKSREQSNSGPNGRGRGGGGGGDSRPPNSFSPLKIQEHLNRLSVLPDSQNNVKEFSLILKELAYASRGANAPSFPQLQQLGASFLRLSALWSVPSNLSADILWSFGTLKLRLPGRGDEVFDQLLHCYVTNSMELIRKRPGGIVNNLADEMKITKGLIGFSRYGRRFSSLSSQQKDELLALIEVYMDSFTQRSVANLIYSMGKIGMCYEELKVSLGQKLIEKFADKLYQFFPQELSNALYGFDLLGAKLGNFSDSLIPAINKALEKNIFAMNSQEYCNTMHSLAAMGFAKENLSESLQVLIRKKFIDILPVLSKNAEISSVYFGFTVLNFRFEEWESEEREKINQFLLVAGKSFDMISLATVLIAYGNLVGEWNRIPKPFQRILLQRFNDIALGISPYWLCCVIQGFGSLGCPWKHFYSLPNYEKFLDLFYKYIPQLANREMGNFLFYLGRMDFHLPSYHDLMYLVNSEVMTRVPTMKATEFSLIMQGLGSCYYQWQMFTIAQMNTIQARIMELLPETDLDFFSRFLYGLQAMSARWERFQPSLIDCIIKGLIQRTGVMNGNTLWRIASSLGELGLSWHLIPSDDRNQLLDQMIQTLRSSNRGNSFAPYILYSLGVLETDWEELSVDVIRSLCENIRDTKESMSLKDLSVGMYGLALLTTRSQYDIPSKGYSEEDQQKPHFHSSMFLWFIHNQFLKLYRDVGIPLFRDADFTQLDRELLASIPGISIYFEFMKCFETTQRCVKDMFRKTKLPVLLAKPLRQISFSPYVSPLIALVREELDRASSSLTNSFPAVHQMCASVSLEEQHRVNSVFVHHKYEIVEEFDGLQSESFPMDIAIFEEYSLASSPTHKEREVIAFLEIDGARHYTSDSLDFSDQMRTNLRRPGLLKEIIYQSRFPHIPIYRIPTITMNQAGFRENLRGTLSDILKSQYQRRLQLLERMRGESLLGGFVDYDNGCVGGGGE